MSFLQKQRGLLVSVHSPYRNDTNKIFIPSDHDLLTPESYWLLVSPYSLTLESNVKIIRIEEMITNLRSS